VSNEITLIGLDIAKLVFQVHGADREGRPLLRRRLRREEVEAFFQQQAPRVVALEAWTKDPSIFKIDPHHLIPGPHT
jgi:transposase